MRVIATGGGTGGHIYPALSILKKIKENEPDSVFLYIGSHNRMEKDVVPNEGIEYKSLKVTGIHRKAIHKNVETLLNFKRAIKDARRYIRDFKPDVVIGTGGYVSSPVIYAAAKEGIPTFILENDAYAGIANRFLSRYVTSIGVCFEAAMKYFPQDKVMLTGNPRGEEVVKMQNATPSIKINRNKKNVLIVMGSLGARYVNEAVIDASKNFNKKDYNIIYVTGKNHYETVRERIQPSSNLTVLPYIDNVPSILKSIDLLVCRSGATSLAENLALGVPSILIPSPYVGNNEQNKNAFVLKEKGVCEILDEKTLTGEILLDSIDSLINDDLKLKKMAMKAYDLGIRDSQTRIYNELKRITKIGR